MTRRGLILRLVPSQLRECCGNIWLLLRFEEKRDVQEAMVSPLKI